MNVTRLTRAAWIKVVNLLGTGDFTHFLYLAEFKVTLKMSEVGLLRYNGNPDGLYFTPA